MPSGETTVDQAIESWRAEDWMSNYIGHCVLADHIGPTLRPFYELDRRESDAVDQHVALLHNHGRIALAPIFVQKADYIGLTRAANDGQGLFLALDDSDRAVMNATAAQEDQLLNDPAIARQYAFEKLTRDPDPEARIMDTTAEELLGNPDDLHRATAVGRLIYRLAHEHTGRAIYQWFFSHRYELDGSSPIQFLNLGEHEAYERVARLPI